MKIFVTVLIFVGLALPLLGNEQEHKSLQELQTEEILLDGTLGEIVVREERRMTIQCMRAFPHEEFRACLGNKLVLAVNMTQYTMAVTVF